MRNIVLSGIVLACFGFQSCKNNENQKEVKSLKTIQEKIAFITCYKAIYESDTIDLQLNTLESGKVVGTMVMKIASAPEKAGVIKGEFCGDTLFADYTFTEGGSKNRTFKNPMAFLKHNEKLILGNGTMQTTMGITYFVKDKPIDFDNVKYKFAIEECK